MRLTCPEQVKAPRNDRESSARGRREEARRTHTFRGTSLLRNRLNGQAARASAPSLRSSHRTGGGRFHVVPLPYVEGCRICRGGWFQLVSWKGGRRLFRIPK